MRATNNSPIKYLLTFFIIGIAHAKKQPKPDPEFMAWLDTISNLLPFIIVIALVTYYLHKKLHFDVATQKLVKKYITYGRAITGNITSSDPLPSIRRTSTTTTTHMIDVLYTAKEHRHTKNTRMKFRNPEAFTTKQFFRRFETSTPATKGDTVDVIVLPSNPRSGCTREMLEGKSVGYDHHKTIKNLAVGVGLMCVVLVLAMTRLRSMESGMMVKGAVVLVVGIVMIQGLLWVYFETMFMQKAQRTFFSAKPMVSSEEANEVRQMRRTGSSKKED